MNQKELQPIMNFQELTEEELREIRGGDLVSGMGSPAASSIARDLSGNGGGDSGWNVGGWGKTFDCWFLGKCGN